MKIVLVGVCRILSCYKLVTLSAIMTQYPAIIREIASKRPEDQGYILPSNLIRTLGHMPQILGYFLCEMYNDCSIAGGFEMSIQN